MSEGAVEQPDLCRSCVWCGRENNPEAMGVWRDADGAGHWLHGWCAVDSAGLPLSGRHAARRSPEVATADDPDVELCTVAGVDHDWRPHQYVQFNRPHTSWRCVWCHAVACGDYDEADPCMEPYHHSGQHRSRAGVTWPLGGERPAVR